MCFGVFLTEWGLIIISPVGLTGTGTGILSPSLRNPIP